MELKTEKPAEVESHRHLHRCQNCGTIWGHGNMLASDVEAHKCPKCGRTEWKHFSGGQAVTRTAAAEKPPQRNYVLTVLGIAVLAAAIVVALDLAINFLLPRKP